MKKKSLILLRKLRSDAALGTAQHTLGDVRTE